jgi:hypothetical protein
MLCRVIGAIIIVIGLYLVLWGMRKDQPMSHSIAAAPNGQQMATLTESMGTSNHVGIDITLSPA